MVQESLDKVSFTREDLLNYLPILEGLYKCFYKKHVIDWILKKGSSAPQQSDSVKKDEG